MFGDRELTKPSMTLPCGEGQYQMELTKCPSIERGNRAENIFLVDERSCIELINNSDHMLEETLSFNDCSRQIVVISQCSMRVDILLILKACHRPYTQSDDLS